MCTLSSSSCWSYVIFHHWITSFPSHPFFKEKILCTVLKNNQKMSPFYWFRLEGKIFLPLFIGSDLGQLTWFYPFLLGQTRIKLHIFTPFYWVRERENIFIPFYRVNLNNFTPFYWVRKWWNYIFLPFFIWTEKGKLYIFTPFYWVRFGVNQKMRLKGDLKTWKASFLGKESPNLDGQEIRNFVAQDS